MTYEPPQYLRRQAPTWYPGQCHVGTEEEFRRGLALIPAGPVPELPACCSPRVALVRSAEAVRAVVGRGYKASAFAGESLWGQATTESWAARVSILATAETVRAVCQATSHYAAQVGERSRAESANPLKRVVVSVAGEVSICSASVGTPGALGGTASILWGPSGTAYRGHQLAGDVAALWGPTSSLVRETGTVMTAAALWGPSATLVHGHQLAGQVGFLWSGDGHLVHYSQLTMQAGLNWGPSVFGTMANLTMEVGIKWPGIHPLLFVTAGMWWGHVQHPVQGLLWGPSAGMHAGVNILPSAPAVLWGPASEIAAGYVLAGNAAELWGAESTTYHGNALAGNAAERWGPSSITNHYQQFMGEVGLRWGPSSLEYHRDVLPGSAALLWGPSAALYHRNVLPGSAAVLWGPFSVGYHGANLPGSAAVLWSAPATTHHLQQFLAEGAAVLWGPTSATHHRANLPGNAAELWGPSFVGFHRANLPGNAAELWGPFSVEYHGADIYGSAAELWGPSGSPYRGHPFDGSAAVLWAPTSAIKVGHKLAGSAAVLWGPSATLKAGHALAGSAAVRWDGSGDFDVPVPVGTIVAWGGTGAAPTGWLKCDGSAVSQTTYAALYAVVGLSYGAPGGGNFSLPDLRGKFPFGAGLVGANSYPVGSQGGEDYHTLTTAEMPAHSHGPASGFSQFFERGTATGFFNVAANAGNLDNFNAATGDTGGGVQHQNMPPYCALGAYLIKT